MQLARTLGIVRSLALYYGVPFRRGRMQELYRALVPSGGLCFDVGAHVGNHLRCFRSLGARVVALEPQPDFARILRRLYGSDPGVTILDAAVGAEPGVATLLASIRTPTVTSLNAQWVEQVGASVGFEHVSWARGPTVAVTTLDALVAHHGVPDFVKIDVEDWSRLYSPASAFPLPALSFEFLPAAKDQAAACIDRLATLGEYRYNWSFGEKSRFESQSWVGRQAACNWLSGVKPDSGSGDFYARLVSPTPMTDTR